MAIGDTLVKLANQQPLTEDEKLQLRLWGNQGENINSFVAGLQNGSSPITSRSIESQTGNFITPPINAAWFGWSTLASVSFPQNLSASNTFTTIKSGFTDYVINPQSCVRWYDQANGKIMLSQQFASSSPRIISMSGTVMWGSPSTAGQLNIYVKKKSDDTQVAAAGVYRDTASADCGGICYPFSINFNLSSFSTPPQDIYFEFQSRATYGTASCGTAVEVLFHRTL